MAQPVNTYDSYDLVGMREDLTDAIYNISPEETPFYTKCAKISVSNRLHEWQTDVLASPAVNAHIEGDDTTAAAIVPTARIGNRIQHFKKSITISGVADMVDKAGRETEMAYQIRQRLKEIKRDVELALFANQAKVTGSSVLAPQMAGVGAWITTNTQNVGGGGADPTGDGSNARTDGTQSAFTQADFDLAMTNIWEEGGRPDTVYLSSFQMDVALGFVGNNNERANTDSSKATVTNDLVVYRTPWGKVNWQMSRMVRSRDVWIMQSDMWKVGHMRTAKNEALAKTGDSEKRQILTDATLICCNEKASGGVVDCSTS